MKRRSRANFGQCYDIVMLVCLAVAVFIFGSALANRHFTQPDSKPSGVSKGYSGVMSASISVHSSSARA